MKIRLNGITNLVVSRDVGYELRGCCELNVFISFSFKYKSTTSPPMTSSFCKSCIIGFISASLSEKIRPGISTQGG